MKCEPKKSKKFNNTGKQNRTVLHGNINFKYQNCQAWNMNQRKVKRSAILKEKKKTMLHEIIKSIDFKAMRSKTWIRKK